jgi:hypothetical protein
MNLLRDDGILIGTDNPRHNFLRMRPTVPFNTEGADVLASKLALVSE